MGEQPLGDGVLSSPHIYVTTLVLQRRRTHEQMHTGTRDIDSGNCGSLEDLLPATWRPRKGRKLEGENPFRFEGHGSII